ncbi:MULTISPECIES: nuclear transport factor 2 family protein [Croceitalea]|uniref:Nuclear transport factor 2 family protein n=1 Tax=Croceitalea vernalis TaxID=3075599 RepID=A0ABU3BHV3_9FLAO|nr:MULTISPECIES: nuclear transport factor 2 family protein [unclassified Croceitalea]MDT0539927.1 nuclear transport factor 2 family protein [Croceitalea sp. P059]MDT0621747.1 nuclear transport factor 2 family protein [Croceitalea sp. P007]
MKKIILIVLVLLGVTSVTAQEKEETAVKRVVETFFEGFHKQDSVLMKSVLAREVVLQTTGRNKEGKTQFKNEKINRLITSIVSIPDSVSFEEKLTSWSIQVDRTMANAWVGYEFWLNGQFSHCGINSFQMVNFDGEWKIIYLIDTRGKSGCLKE